MNKNCKIKYIPPKGTKILSEIVLFYMVNLVPYGYLTREDDIKSFLSKMYNNKYISFERPINLDFNYWSKFTDNVPFYRIVSAYGYTVSTYGYSDKSSAEKLAAEGFEFEQSSSQSRGPKVKDYKKHLFDFSNADISFEMIEKINNENDFDV